MKRLTLLSALTALTLSSTAILAQDNPMVGGAEMFADRTIVENAVNSADHTTLVAAVQAADLVDTLSGEGPFTVLAPVNAAFDALPEGTVDTLLLPENQGMLQTVLGCHVIPALALSTDIASMVADDGGAHEVETVGGCVLTLETTADGGVTVTDENGTVANVTIADVRQSNGVIHVIDAVLTPMADDEMAAEEPMADDAMATDEMAAEPMADDAMATDAITEDDAMADDEMADDEMAISGDFPMVGGAPMLPTRNIIENALDSADHTTLVAAVQAAGLVETLQGPGPFTVFAPTNAAFEKLPAGTVDTLLMEENRDDLVKVLTAHVVAGNLSAADLASRARANGGRYNMETVSGDALTAVLRGQFIYIFDEAGGAGLVSIADVNQSNGVIHVVDDVLLPR